MMTDPIADMLTRIRNAGSVRLARVSIPRSRMRISIARVLKERGFIRDYAEDEDPKKPTLTIELRYTSTNEHIIEGIERISKPSRRVYVGARDIPRLRGGLGVTILSTAKGVMTDEEAREAHVGGELLARVW